jgi:starvation-inducible DNA-binding protein
MMKNTVNGKPAKAMFKTSIGMDKATRERMVALLNEHLACTFDLMSQTKQAHWNVKGPHFIGLHEMFDEFAEGLENHVDEIAERATALGGYATGTVRMAASASQLDEYPVDVINDLDHVKALAGRYAALGKMIREAIEVAATAGDADTADLFTEVSRDLDKWLWFLEAHVQA